MRPGSSPADSTSATSSTAKGDNPGSIHSAPAIESFVQFYEQLSAADLTRLETLYTPEIVFKDPFQEVQGVAALRAVFTHMFAKLEAPRFVVLTRVLQGQEGFVTWEMHFRFRKERQTQVIRGATHLRFADDGRICLHRDYWDAAEEFYEKLPLLGTLLRFLKKSARA